MAGVFLQVQLDGLAAMQSRLELLGRIDIAPLRHDLGAVVESQTRRRISEEKASPEGEPWKDWSPAYAATRHGGHSLLEDEGNLVDDIHFVVAGEAIEVGSNLVYAAIQHAGGAEVGIDIPAREYLGLSDGNWSDLVDATDAFVSRVLR
ncbi:Phage virion morphogenesis protein [uncultured Alphaproteobacteria bacterium]|uniref:Phage virion morphogenesis protein n=1 Tax=uncultured Alphaproteobacteria bacterium TaxID=91750 RepID=A0A212KBS6_9PROT|nr:Phage virion morphogenesis protein [uncultured Alphaproteobacteria bacterium]